MSACFGVRGVEVSTEEAAWNDSVRQSRIEDPEPPDARCSPSNESYSKQDTSPRRR